MNTKIGGSINVQCAKDKEAKYLTKDQAIHLYKKIESIRAVNVDRIEQEIEDDKLTRDKEDKVNPYQKIVVNNIDMDNNQTSQMEHWPILSNIVNYVQYDRNPKNFHELKI